MISKKTMRGQPRSRLAARVARAPARHNVSLLSVCVDHAPGRRVSTTRLSYYRKMVSATRVRSCVWVSPLTILTPLSLSGRPRALAVMMALWPHSRSRGSR